MKHLSHNCCAATLCNSRSDNRKDLLFHAFPKDQILRKTWGIKMKHGEKNLLPTEPSILLFGALETDYTKRVSQVQGEILLKIPFLPILHGQIITVKCVRGLKEQESAGTKQLSHSTKSYENEKYSPLISYGCFRF